MYFISSPPLAWRTTPSLCTSINTGRMSGSLSILSHLNGKWLCRVNSLLKFGSLTRILPMTNIHTCTMWRRKIKCFDYLGMGKYFMECGKPDKGAGCFKIDISISYRACTSKVFFDKNVFISFCAKYSCRYR